MASQPNPIQKASSRWGSFLAGVESRLDTILADEDAASKSQSKEDVTHPAEPAKKEPMVVPPTGSAAPRTSSRNRAQDRLNERLARAMANKNLGKKADGSVSSSKVPSPTATPVNGVAGPTASTKLPGEKRENEDSKDEEEKTSADLMLVTNGMKDDTRGEQDAGSESGPLPLARNQELLDQSSTPKTSDLMDESVPQRQSWDSHRSVSTRQSLELTQPSTPKSLDSPTVNDMDAPTSPRLSQEYEKTIEQLRSDHETAELRRQEEMHEYLERIDALQAKLKYLTKEAAEVAKKASSEAPAGSLEQKLAAKDENIALLIEEGQKLSQTELKHMTVIKKLRAKSTEDEKAAAESKRLAEKHEKAAREAQDRAKRTEAAEKRALEKVRVMSRLEKDLESAQIERDGKDLLIRDLQLQLAQATSAAKQAEEKARAEALEAEKKHAADLADELSTVKTEKELAEKDYQNSLRELREKAEREKERARVAEIERQGEQNILESRLEAYRARAEEASAGQGGDVHAKLLRQIETLQNQYAVASENWQGIEGSLMSRVTTLEKERDDMAKREADIRRKARESNTKHRRIEEELERVNAKMQDMEHELSSSISQLAILHDRLTKSEANAATARNDLQAERDAWEPRLTQRLEEERGRIREELLRNQPEDLLYQRPRTESPVTRTHTRKSSAGASPHARRIPSLVPTDRPVSRRSTTQPFSSGGMVEFLPQRIERVDSMGTIPQLSVNNGIPEIPTLEDMREYDYFSGIQSPATPPERTINDLISVSTAAAGPSVQLVERMSAAVRRLESEKAAHKDELSRLSGQRDEAREQVVELMRDNELKRAVDERVRVLEGELGGVKERYLTTLEMLGEKSERVEELKADVQDLKGMYRELVESTMK